MPRHKTSTRRRVLVTLRESGPMTAADLADVLEVAPALVKNLCSELARVGVLDEHFGPRGRRRGRGYGALVEAIPADVDLVEQLVDAYGAKLMRKMVADAVKAAS